MIYEIVVDAGETANKCTIAPLALRRDFRLFRVHGEGPLGPLSAPILLHHEGHCISELKSKIKSPPALASIDCVWRRLPRLISRIEWVDQKQPVLAKIPEGFKTAYPRVAAKNTDPSGGLATIEAIFIAAAILGNADLTLLSKYYFGRSFIEMNLQRFSELGVTTLVPELMPAVPALARTSLTRRLNRGRLG